LPSLFRFLFVVALLAALVYGGMLALVAFVKVQPREITQTVTLPKAPAPVPAALPAKPPK
jgi:hypothetical protein